MVHRLRVDTRQGIFELDGKRFDNSAISCKVEFQHSKNAIVILTFLADVSIDTDVEVKTERI